MPKYAKVAKCGQNGSDDLNLPKIGENHENCPKLPIIVSYREIIVSYRKSSFRTEKSSFRTGKSLNRQNKQSLQLQCAKIDITKFATNCQICQKQPNFAKIAKVACKITLEFAQNWPNLQIAQKVPKLTKLAENCKKSLNMPKLLNAAKMAQNT